MLRVNRHEEEVQPKNPRLERRLHSLATLLFNHVTEVVLILLCILIVEVHGDRAEERLIARTKVPALAGQAGWLIA